MKFGTLTENQLKTSAGGSLDKLIEIWHRDVADKNGNSIDINLCNRRDSNSPMRGGILTTAAIEMKDGRVRMIIWYDPLELFYEARIAELGYAQKVIQEITLMLQEDRDPGSEYDPVAHPEKLDFGSISGQIARWLLKFRGFKKLANENKNFFELETFLNLECVIPALYSVLEEAGIEIATLENKRFDEVFEGLRNMDEPEKRIDRTLNALRISNIIEFSPDSEKRRGLEELVESRFSRVQAVKEEIDELKKDYDLIKPEGLNAFMRKFVLKYRLPGTWMSFDETTGIF